MYREAASNYIKINKFERVLIICKLLYTPYRRAFKRAPTETWQVLGLCSGGPHAPMHHSSMSHPQVSLYRPHGMLLYTFPYIHIATWIFCQPPIHCHHLHCHIPIVDFHLGFWYVFQAISPFKFMAASIILIPLQSLLIFIFLCEARAL